MNSSNGLIFRGSDVGNLNFCVGFVIRNLRREMNMSGEDLGMLTGYSQQQVSRYERGTSNFTFPCLMLFCAALGVSVWDLLDRVRVFYLSGDDNYYPQVKVG